ncbi:MAG TPA: 2-oxoglutarate dehydrogenase E1 component, partial [Gammaproteobacteria bacterium]|nr:2-oxoglutarate dehydrogenase E1 component [Gammaproteobacteria bacterium]
MKKNKIISWKAQNAESMLYSGNALYLEFLYEQYLEDPQQIDPRWQQYFSALPKVNGNLSEQSLSATREYFQHYEPTLSSGAVCSQPLANARTQDQKQVRVLQLINAYRFLGHKKAQINPLEDGSTVDVPELTLDHHELSESDLNTVFNTGSLVAPDK